MFRQKNNPTPANHSRIFDSILMETFDEIIDKTGQVAQNQRRQQADQVLKKFQAKTPWYKSKAEWAKQKDSLGKTRLIYTADFCNESIHPTYLTPRQSCLLTVLSERFPTRESIFENQESEDEFNSAVETAIKAGNIFFFQALKKHRLLKDEIIWKQCLKTLEWGVNGQIIENLCQIISRVKLKCDIRYMLKIYETIAQFDKEDRSRVQDRFLDAFNHDDHHYPRNDTQQRLLEDSQIKAIDNGDLTRLEYSCRLARITQTPQTIISQHNYLLTYIAKKQLDNKLSIHSVKKLLDVINAYTPKLKNKNIQQEKVGNLRTPDTKSSSKNNLAASSIFRKRVSMKKKTTVYTDNQKCRQRSPSQ